jgi:hypothetical protein
LIDYCENFEIWDPKMQLKVVFPWEYLNQTWTFEDKTEINWLLDVWRWGDEAMGESIFGIHQLS